MIVSKADKELFHPAANLLPLMDDEAFAELKDSIRRDSQYVTVMYFEDKIIDGRNRYLACQELGVEATEQELESCDDPVAYVLQENLHRRHLNPSQRSMVAAKVREFYAEKAKERQRAAGGDRKSSKAKSVKANFPEAILDGQARDQAGAAMGVSGKSVDAASKVLTRGCADLVHAVETGEIAVSRAAKIAELPKAEQKQALAEPPPLAKPRSRFERAIDLWREMTDQERDRFLQWTDDWKQDNGK